MKTTPSKSHLAALLAALALPAGFAFGQAALPAPTGVNLQGTGNITNAPAVTLPNSTNATPTAPNFSWEGTNLLQGYLLPVSNFTGRTTTGGSVNYEDLLPLKVNKLQVMQGAAGAAPTGVGTLIDALGIDTASVITDVLKVKDATTGTDVPITVNNGVLNVNGSAPQTLSLSGNALTLSNGGGTITLPAGAGTVTNIATGTGLTGGPITGTGTISLADSGAAAGTYGSGSAVPIINVDSKGRITGVSTTPVNNLYNADGSLSSARVVTLGANNLTLDGTTGNLVFNGGGVKVNGNRTLEFGAGVAGKQNVAGSIGYQAFGNLDSLDIVGAGPGHGSRKVRIWDNLLTGAITADSLVLNGATIDGKNLYNSDGTLVTSRVVTLGANDLTLNGTTGNLVFNGPSLKINHNRHVEFGADVANKENNAGRIAYQVFGNQNALDIVGAGSVNGERLVNIWDKLETGTIRATISISSPSISTSNLTVNGTFLSNAISTQFLEVTGHEILLGKNNLARGDSGASRALVKGNNNTLVMNLGGDFTSGVRIDSAVNILGNTSINGSATINANATIIGLASVGSTLQVGGNIEVTQHEIQLGKNNLERGDSGLSRALVKGSNNTLVANLGGDFTGGVRIDSKVTIAGDSTQNLSNLYVGPATAGTDGTFGYLNAAGTVGTASGFQTFSIYGVNTIATGGEFRAYSDARIKEHVSSISSATSLETLNHLLLRKYKYKDTVMHGNKVKSGVFAQDVEKVFPEAVDYAMEFIPNVYQKATVSESNTVQIKTDLSKGDKVRMYDAKNHEIVVEVTAVTSKNFTVDQKIEAKEVFVYGKQVKDFRHVDYDRLTVLNLSATQELAKRAEAQAKELATVKAEKTVLAQAVKTQAAEIASLKKQQAAEIAQIKAALEAMNKLVAAKVTEKATKVVSTTAR